LIYGTNFWDTTLGQSRRLRVRALQIAAANLKHMEAEKPRPVQVVVDPAKVA
jgi:hypothetical protein